jgi:hypothetical protein
MAGKYADRFRESPSSPARDVLDLGELDRGSNRAAADHDHEDEIFLGHGPDTPWHHSWAARLALVAALIVGVGAGAYGWERWREREAEIAARSVIDLSASALTLNYAGETEVTVAVDYQNSGPHEIVISDARFDTDHLALTRAPDVLEIAAGETGTHILQLQAECENGFPEPMDELPLVVTIETVDGTVHEHVIDHLPTDFEIRDWYSYACAVGAYELSFSETYADFTAVTRSPDGLAVQTRVSFGFRPGTRVQIDDVAARSAAFVVDHTSEVPGSNPSFIGPFITEEYRVGDCQIALNATENDMALVIVGAVEDSKPSALSAYPTPELAIELSRLAYTSCNP